MACSLKTGFSVYGSNDALLGRGVKGSLAHCPGALQFVDSRPKEFMGKQLDVSFQNISNGDAKTPPSFCVKAQASICVSRALRWWEKTLKPNMVEIHSATELVDSLLNAGDRLVIVDFYSPGCGGCKALHPKICQLAESNPNAIFLKVNYEELKTMCHSLHIHVLPFFRFYRGAEGRLCSFSCTNATIKKFKDALAKYGSELCSLGPPPRGLDESEILALASAEIIMGRAKLDMHLISKEKSRHTTFKKRKEGLVRKIHEFTTLCDVNACMIIHPPKQENHSAAETEIWPENPDEVSRIINIYKGNSNVSASRNFALSDFYHCRKKKIQEELEKKRRKRMEMVYPTWIDSMSYLPGARLRDFATSLGNKYGILKCKIDSLKGSSTDHFPPIPQNMVLMIMDGALVPQQQQMMIDNDSNNSSRLMPGSMFQRNIEWDVSAAAPVYPNEMHVPQLHYQANIDQEHHYQQLIHPVNPTSMMGLLMNENDHYHGTASNCNVQYASFKHEIVCAPPGGGVGPVGVLENAGPYGCYPVSLPGYHCQSLQPQPMGPYMQYPTMSDVHVQPHLQPSREKEYNDFFHYPMKDHKERR